MKYAYYGFGMLLFGAMGLILIVMMQTVTINNDSEYYNLKEAMKAAMIESIDIACYRRTNRLAVVQNTDDCGTGKIKISEQKFVENFTRRFIKTIGGDAVNYNIEFYDIIESPPKASVVIRSKTNDYGPVSGSEGLNITNSLSGILEQDLLIKLVGRQYVKIDLEKMNEGYIDLIEEENRKNEELENRIIESQKNDELINDDSGISADQSSEVGDDDPVWENVSGDSNCTMDNCNLNNLDVSKEEEEKESEGSEVE